MPQRLAPTVNLYPNGRLNLPSMKAHQLLLMLVAELSRLNLAATIASFVIIVARVNNVNRVSRETIIAIIEIIHRVITTIKILATATETATVVVAHQVAFAIHVMTAHKVQTVMSRTRCKNLTNQSIMTRLKFRVT
ncbi:unannotated protein [freshwater metagenome]|uniref:Unannotated protein n=1 Tax=freshwater metagenome TaxID=449393 RepID=A0A6J6V0Z0_9ZZZZ